MKKENLSRVTVILRGYTYDQVRAVARAMEGSNFNSMEITTNSPDMLNTLSKISEEFEDLAVGAGTVLNYKQAVEVIDAGARFILSPIMLDQKTIEYCRDKGVISVPAAMTPTEIYQLFERGADIVKVFPATTVGPKFFKDVQGPLGDLDLMAVGGLNSSNSKDFLDMGCKYLGLGSGIFNKQDILNQDVEELRKSLKEFEECLEA